MFLIPEPNSSARETSLKTFAITGFFEKILDFCEVPRTKKEITEYFNLKNAKGFGKRYLTPLISEGKLKMTIPEKPTSSKQKYISVSKS